MNEEELKRAYSAPAHIKTWALYVLCAGQVALYSELTCHDCAGCRRAVEAAHEAFFILPVEMRDALCRLCFQLNVEPIDVFGWEPEDFLWSAN